MRLSVNVIAGVLLLAISGAAFANTDQDLVGAVQKGIGLVYVLKLLAMAVFFAAGAYFAGSGIMQIVKSTKQGQNESPLTGLAKFGLGVTLCVLPFVIGLTANTFLDGGAQEANSNIQAEGANF